MEQQLFDQATQLKQRIQDLENLKKFLFHMLTLNTSLVVRSTVSVFMIQKDDRQEDLGIPANFCEFNTIDRDAIMAAIDQHIVKVQAQFDAL